MEILFKYNHDLPELIYDMTDSMIGFSRLDDKPVFKIIFDINEDLVNDILCNSNEREDYIGNISLFLRGQKTNKILNHINDSEMDKFTTFVQYYYDHLKDVVVLQIQN